MSTDVSNVRYAITHINADGYRILSYAAQGRNMHASRDKASAWLSSMLTNNSQSTLESVHGKQATGTYRVDAFDCYDHGDPKGIYVSKYHVTFNGRTSGALGVTHPCAVTVEASGEDAAILQCYETHEHISSPKVTEVDAQ